MKTAARELSAALGIVGISIGLYLAWPPLAWIAGGGIMLGMAVVSWMVEQRTRAKR